MIYRVISILLLVFLLSNPANSAENMEATLCDYIADLFESKGFSGLLREIGIEKNYKSIRLRSEKVAGLDRNPAVLSYELDIDGDGRSETILEHHVPIFGHAFFEDLYLLPYGLKSEMQIRDFIESKGWERQGPKIHSILFEPVDLNIPLIHDYYKRSKYLTLNFVELDNDKFLLVSYMDFESMVRNMYLIRFESIESSLANLVCSRSFNLN